MKYLCLLIFLTYISCTSNEATYAYVEGLNIIKYDNGNLKELVFYKNKVKHGPFVKAEENGNFTNMGTYNSNKKSGLWSSYKEGKMAEQIYYKNDSVIRRVTPTFELHPCIDTSLKFCFLKPSAWINEKTKGALVFSYSNTYEGSSKPSYNILEFNSNFKTLAEIKAEQIKGLAAESIHEATFINDEVIKVITTNKGIKTVSLLKIIRVEKDDRNFLMTCTCLEQDYPTYGLLFNTMVLSFN